MDPLGSTQRQLVGTSWVVRLRWLAGGGHLGLLLAAWAWGVAVPWGSSLVIVALGAGSNLALWLGHRRGWAGARGLVGVMGLDVLLLTALLAASGGAANPFSFLYLVPVVLSAMVAPPSVSWGVVLLGAVAYGSLFLLPARGMPQGTDMRSHLLGMWVAYALSGPAIAFAITRLRQALGEVDAQAAEAVRQRDRAQRLASLATLAAGAAHELATPLSTIAVAAGELPAELKADAELIREEVARCHAILRQLSADVGAPLGEMRQGIALADLAEEVLEGRAWAAEVEVRLADPEALVSLPVGLVSQAARRLLGNARDAGGHVVLELTEVGGGLRMVVTDDGLGMAPEVLARATEPFFTTKEEGMGLGLFFVLSVAERLGGTLRLEAPGRGTRAVFELPGTEL